MTVLLRYLLQKPISRYENISVFILACSIYILCCSRFEFSVGLAHEENINAWSGVAPPTQLMAPRPSLMTSSNRTTSEKHPIPSTAIYFRLFRISQTIKLVLMHLIQHTLLFQFAVFNFKVLFHKIRYHLEVLNWIRQSIRLY